MSDYIPNHLLANILLRLPFESLLQSRRVSKSWLALIDSPEFVRMHFNTYCQDDDSSTTTTTTIVSLSENKYFYTLDFDDKLASIDTAKRLNYSPLDHPPETDHKVRIVGSCNGLVCLVCPNTSKVSVWNPWIQKAWELPPPPVEYSMFGGADLYLGFGYDCVNDDYKVLNKMRFFDVFDEDQSSWLDEVYVYSFRLKSWRRMEHFGSSKFPEKAYYIRPRDCIFVSGALHWMMEEKDENENDLVNVMSFHLSSEEFQTMACPRQQPLARACYEKLLPLNGCLCFITSYFAENGRKCADLWLMEDYGVVGSWTKLTTIEMPLHYWVFWILTPLVYSKNNGRLLLQIDGEKFVVYDVETQSMSDVVINGAELRYLDSFVSVGSLIRPF